MTEEQILKIETDISKMLSDYKVFRGACGGSNPWYFSIDFDHIHVLYRASVMSRMLQLQSKYNKYIILGNWDDYHIGTSVTMHEKSSQKTNT